MTFTRSSAALAAVSLFVLGFAVGAEKAVHRHVTAPDLPARPGAPYSQGVLAGDVLFLSGNIGQDPTSGRVPESFADEARQSLDNLGRVLKAAGLGWEHVAKVNVYVEDIGRYDEFNQLYTKTLTAPFPARTFLAVADIPGGGQIEIEAVAVRPR
jgi:2-iminobutanoate/2-iminopropanoate deaminase